MNKTTFDYRVVSENVPSVLENKLNVLGREGFEIQFTKYQEKRDQFVVVLVRKRVE